MTSLLDIGEWNIKDTPKDQKKSQFRRHEKVWGFVGSLCSYFSYPSSENNMKICIIEWMKELEHSNEYANCIGSL